MSAEPLDIVNNVLGVQAHTPMYALRQFRSKVVTATQGSALALFDPELDSPLILSERLLLAVYACQLAGNKALADFYQQRLQALELPAHWLGNFSVVRPQAFGTPRLQSLLAFTRSLTLNPVEGDRAALERLQLAGLDSASIVLAAQLLAFIAYQIRLTAGLAALAEEHPEETLLPEAGPRAAEDLAEASIDIQSFTNRTLGWKSWLTVLNLEDASPQQVAVLEESHPKAKVSEYYLTLIHQPAVLQQRSLAFNAIMYAPGGLPRAERELASTVVSRVNRCVYCASVHAQRYTQLAKRAEVIREVFTDPDYAGRTLREKAIIQLSVDLTRAPAQFGKNQLTPGRQAGLSENELLDLVHTVAIFAWANRLMLNLGEPVLDAD